MSIYYGKELYHSGIKGQKWGNRRFQYEDGKYTEEGKARRRTENSSKSKSNTSKKIFTSVALFGVTYLITHPDKIKKGKQIVSNIATNAGKGIREGMMEAPYKLGKVVGGGASILAGKTILDKLLGYDTMASYSKAYNDPQLRTAYMNNINGGN